MFNAKYEQDDYVMRSLLPIVSQIHFSINKPPYGQTLCDDHYCFYAYWIIVSECCVVYKSKCRLLDHFDPIIEFKQEL